MLSGICSEIILINLQKNLDSFYCKISSRTCQVSDSKPVGVKFLIKIFLWVIKLLIFTPSL